MLDAARRLVSARTVVRHQQKIGLLARLWYHALTTGLGTQTLGEEYCDLHQTDAIGAAPSSFRRVALVLLEAMAPVVLKRARARARRVATRRENDDDDDDDDGDENEGGAGDVSADERRSRAADAATARAAASSASPSPSSSSTPAAAASGAAREARWTWTPPNARALLARALRRAARAADDAAVAVFHPPATRADGGGRGSDGADRRVSASSASRGVLPVGDVLCVCETDCGGALRVRRAGRPGGTAEVRRPRRVSRRAVSRRRRRRRRGGGERRWRIERRGVSHHGRARERRRGGRRTGADGDARGGRRRGRRRRRD